jgi:ribonuclease Z
VRPWSHRLLDGKTDYPGVHLVVDGRGLLFDCGEGSLPPRQVHELEGIFLSHLHIDHFLGFDRLISHGLDCGRTFPVFGPPGTARGVQAKLAAYTWNLVAGDALRFEVMDLAEHSRRTWTLSVPHRMELTELASSGAGLEEPILGTRDYEVRAAHLDHRTPCLAYSFRERELLNFDLAAAGAAGLAPGAWMAELKARADEPEAFVEVAGQLRQVRDLEGLLRRTPGRVLTYATDLRFDSGNVERLVALAASSDVLYLEANFLDEVDKAFASSHLTAGQAGEIAARAGVKELVLFHHSRKYRGQEHRFVAEAARWFKGQIR